MKSVRNIDDSRFTKLAEVFDLSIVSETEGCWLAGGALRTLLDKDDDICDIDLFFYGKVQSMQVEVKLKEQGYRETFRCPKGELLTVVKEINGKVSKVQLITKFYYPSQEFLISTFDIVPSCASWDGQTLVFANGWIDCVRKKLAKLQPVTYPVATIKRLIKYSMKGYFVPSADIKNMVVEINASPLDEAALALYVD